MDGMNSQIIRTVGLSIKSFFDFRYKQILKS